MKKGKMPTFAKKIKIRKKNNCKNDEDYEEVNNRMPIGYHSCAERIGTKYY
jgi:hypothetical protein